MTEGQKHTAGSVALAPHSNTSVVAEKRLVAACGGYSSNVPGEDAHAENEANARRVVACWNACVGISTESLEGGLVKDLTEACRLLLLSSEGQCAHDPDVLRARQNLARTVLAKAKPAAEVL